MTATAIPQTTPTFSPITSTRVQLMPLYNVVLHNDDVNDMGHVVRVLVEILGLSGEEAIQSMLEAHEEGCTVVRTEPKEHAEFHQDQLQSYSLVATIEPAD